MSGLVLHDHPWSSNAQKARLMLDLLGLEYATREVPFEAERADWHVAVNPTGGIPALLDGDYRLAESNTILRYLADREARDDLYPRDPGHTPARPRLGPKALAFERLIYQAGKAQLARFAAFTDADRARFFLAAQRLRDAGELAK